MPDDGVGSGKVVACQRESIRTLETVGETGEKRRSRLASPFARFASLERMYVFSLPAFLASRHVELHGLALLKALETSRLDRGEMHKNIFAVLTADEAVALGVVEPLYSSLFCHVDMVSLSIDLRWREIGSIEGRLLPARQEPLTTDSV